MDKEIIREGCGPRALDYWANAAAATFKFRVFREDGSVLDDSTELCKSMEPTGTFKILLEKKFKVESWESYLKTMRRGEVARFSSTTVSCVQYASVSRMLRDIEKGKTPHGCMGALAPMGSGHGHSHGEAVDELSELLSTPEELTFEFELLKVDGSNEHENEVWAMDQKQQASSAPKLETGNEHFKRGEYAAAGECYEKALQCVDLLLSAELRMSDGHKETKVALLNNLSECLLRLGRWREAERRAGEVLELEPQNHKGLWRRGKARRQLHEITGCKNDFNSLVALKPSMATSVDKELAELEITISARDNQLRRGLKNMF